MPNWINRHIGEICLVGFAGMMAAGYSLSYQLGQNVVAHNQIIESVGENSDKIDALLGRIDSLKTHIDGEFRVLGKRIKVKQTDLKAILLATQTVREDDMFYAAIIDESIWIFPSNPLREKFIEDGLEPEPATDYLTGFKVMPASASD